MVSKRKARLIAAVCAGALALGAAGAAWAYSTKLHQITAKHLIDIVRKNNCKIPLRDWNKGHLKATKAYLNANRGRANYTVKLNSEICSLLKNQTSYVVSASTGPDTFFGMFGNTDPSHAETWNTAWQIMVLWQNAKTKEEKAFSLGWLIHFAGDLMAHGLANLHARGIWMENSDPGTVWRHVLSEVYYAHKMLPFPKGFDNRLVWPEAFVKKMFFNPNSPIYRHSDYLLSRRHEKLGMVAKVFTSAYRMFFLLWDFHGKEMHRWRGHKDYYIPRKNKSVSDYLHWLFADQAYNLHKKKMVAAKKVIDRWYVGTHRAQQAIVADGVAKFTGKTGYTNDGGKKNAYRAKGVGGLIDAYKYVGEAIGEYLSPDVVTITNENFPVLRKIIDGVKSALSVLTGLRSALRKLKEILLAPFRLIGHAIRTLLDPVIQKAKDWLMDKAICGRMPEMCKTINAQKKHFKITPRNVNSYMNWPIYRNTITAAALMLEQLQKASKTAGDETMSPVFGLPSGDFGCTASCTKARRSQPRLFMPMAGTYFQNRNIKANFPDYCMTTASATRRNIALNEKYKNMTNNQANSGYTCYSDGTKVVKAVINPRIRKALILRKPTTKKAAPKRTIPTRRRRRRFYQLIPSSIKKGIRMSSLLRRNEQPVCAGSCSNDLYGATTRRKFTGKIGEFFQKIYDSVVGRWDFHVHPAGKASTVVRSEGGGTICYKALKYDAKTLAGPLPNVDSENAKYYRKTSYSLRTMLGNLFKPLGELFMQGVNAVKTWVTNTFNKVKNAVVSTGKKVCRWVTQTFQSIMAGAKMVACKAACRVKNPNVFNNTNYNRCVSRDCKTTSTKRTQVCN